MAKPLLLTYNLKPDTKAGLDRVCGILGFRVRAVEKAEYALPIGALAGIPVARPLDAKPPTATPFDDEMLVMCHMMSDELNAFLQAMKEEGLPGIGLKAVLTPVNVLWNSAALHTELAREHAAMQRRRP